MKRTNTHLHRMLCDTKLFEDEWWGNKQSEWNGKWEVENENENEKKKLEELKCERKNLCYE